MPRIGEQPHAEGSGISRNGKQEIRIDRSHRNFGVARAFVGGEQRPLPVGEAVGDALDPSVDLQGRRESKLVTFFAIKFLGPP